MAAITADEARGYFERWDLVRDVEIAVLRGTSMETKLRQLESLMTSRSIFSPQLDRQQETEVARERWNFLRKDDCRSPEGSSRRSGVARGSP